MNEDERHAIELLKVHNKSMEDSIEKFSGKVLEKIGDAFLASFKSATDALECCVNIQVGKFLLSCEWQNR